jgi:hypothetical protein
MQRTDAPTWTASLFVIGGLLATSPAFADEPSKIVSWNAYSIQFINPPEFTLLVLPKTSVCRAVVQQGDRTWTVDSPRPQVSLASVWKQIAVKRFSLTLEWRDAQGVVLASEKSTRVKAPGWSGLHEPPADWVAAADKNIAYLMHRNRDRTAPYCEPGVPFWIWSASSPTSQNPKGHLLGYPCNMIPQAIWGLLAHVQSDRPQKEEAMKLAVAGADWTLKNRHPNTGALPQFPFSTISLGEFAGGNEGKAVSLPRAAYLGLSLVDLYRVTHDERYLNYAQHIAEVSARFQRPDGSFPYRVNAQSGAVMEGYSPNAAEFAILAEALEPYKVDPKLLIAAQRAVQWLVAYVSNTNHWQAAYEDVAEHPQYKNLSQYELQVLIPYLCRHKDRDPSYVPLAKRLNAWVEDQFVVFGPESEATAHPVKGPLVFEQYACWYPMEGHTGRWIFSLIELHRTTGDQEYLDKAKAACNAICSQQYSTGAFSTFGKRKLVDGRMTGEDEGDNWYNANLDACAALYQLGAYARSLAAKR